MRRIIGLLAIMAAGLGLLLLIAGPQGPAADAGGRALQSAPVAYGGWAAGLCMGLCLAWLAGVDWSDLPTRFYAWLRVQGRRLALVGLCGVFVGIFLYF